MDSLKRRRKAPPQAFTELRARVETLEAAIGAGVAAEALIHAGMLLFGSERLLSPEDLPRWLAHAVRECETHPDPQIAGLAREHVVALAQKTFGSQSVRGSSPSRRVSQDVRPIEIDS
jgi:hypothetical protein